MVVAEKAPCCQFMQTVKSYHKQLDLFLIASADLKKKPQHLNKVVIIGHRIH